MPKSNTFFVSNRLPFNVKKDGTLNRGSGGLVSALLGVQLKTPFYWFGFETDESASSVLRKNASTIKKNMHLEPVLLEKKLYDSYYDRFCNDVLWPLFHYESQYVQFSNDDWVSYQKANELMAVAILEKAAPHDTVWIHDFHFMLLPEILKRENPSLRVGFFLHTPFPSSEIFRQLPVRTDLLRAMVQCDLIGFHEHSYLRHFTVSLNAHMGIDSSIFRAEVGTHTLRFGVFPISIDTAEMREKAFSEKVSAQLQKYRQKIQSQFLVLGVDRLDYSKGLELKLKGFRRMLQKYPALRGKINLLQVAVPTRVKVPAYIRLKREIDQLVGMINGEFGQPGYVPVQYIYSSVSETDLLALYRRAQCMLITSKRDGMNLVAMEYAICQDIEGPGVIVLSEFVGAASLLGDSLMINPWDEDSIADALYRSFTMDEPEKRKRTQGLHDVLSRYSASQWARTFLNELQISRREQRKALTLPLPTAYLETFPDLYEKIKTADRCRLLLDYDGTLVELQQRPEMVHLSEDIRDLLHRLNAHYDVYIISGRSREFLDSQFDNVDFHLVAEHGAFYKAPGAEWGTRITSDFSSWFPEAKRVMQAYAENVPMSFVEIKSAAVVWHYRQSPTDFAEYQATKLLDELQIGFANFPVTVGGGSKIVEAKAIECNKGSFVRWLQESRKESETAELLICIGDDRTDEDMFRVLGPEDISVKIGRERTAAKYYILQTELQKLLVSLLENRR